MLSHQLFGMRIVFEDVGGHEVLKHHQRATPEQKACRTLLSLAHHVDNLSIRGVWAVTALTFVSIAVSGYLLHSSGLHIAPLYMIPVCLVSWRLGLRAGIVLSLAAAATSMAICLSWWGPGKALALGNLALQLLTLPVLAAIVSSFRCNFDREHFLARRDGKTGAYNRLAFEQRAERMILRAAGEHQRLLLLYLDLDGFKAINDRYGHDAGDRVLEALGASTLSLLRKHDCFGRMGGDEFTILMPLEPNESPEDRAETLHAQLAAALFATSIDATCSMGALVIPPCVDTSLKEVMRRVDRLMYAVKRSGKDSVSHGVLSSASEQAELPLFAGINTRANWHRRSTARSDELVATN
ncbi:MAG: GGDEF domain-containing protein [Bradyrhizobium sp.]|jgi:diguanylate cyclase (GGDEF)-like protein|uniref:GGDEF domain-containing protein n=1 Tax=Hyphomicrobiales TaxID=356 RepID=UPI0009FC26F7|nr:diguanylate cyclase [Shinella sp. HZN7]